MGLSLSVIVLAVGTVFASVFAVVIVFYPRCAGCPGQTPLGTALSVGNGTGACPAGNGSRGSECAVTFAISVYPSGSPPATVPTAGDLSFTLLDPSSMPVPSEFIVILADRHGAWIVSWNSTTTAWAVSTDGACGSPGCLASPLTAGESLLLRAVPDGGLPYSHHGDALRVTAVGGGFSGFVDAPID